MDSSFLNILLFLVGFLTGMGLLWIWQNKRNKQSIKDLQREYDDIYKKLREAETALAVAETNTANFQENLRESKDIQNTLQQNLSEVKSTLARKETENQQLQKRLEEHQEEVQNLRKQFLMEFENIASKLLKSNSKEFAETNQQRLNALLNPFKERIENFEKVIRENQKSRIEEQSSLKAELKSLHELNRQMTEEAKNLTQALKGDTKKQGTWGEVLLEKVLERSGLRKNIEFKREVTVTGENKTIQRPDVVVYLPEGKHIIIDAKVSLNAYEKSIDASDETERNRCLQQHLASVKTHIKTLAEKNYHASEAFKTPEFTLLFMPVEPAFSAVIEFDKNLFNEAWDKKIILVSPTTLLATLRTVSSIWKHEHQTENALKIAREGSKLYDRIALFLTEFEKLEKPLDQAKESYLYLKNKLNSSKQSLAGTALRLQKLGVETSKNLPQSFAESEEESE